jgi:hypothetical protein
MIGQAYDIAVKQVLNSILQSPTIVGMMSSIMMKFTIKILPMPRRTGIG